MTHLNCLVDLVQIILNLAKKAKEVVGVLQAKGRLYEILLSGKISVTESFPLMNEILPKDIVPSFRSDSELIATCMKLYNDIDYKKISGEQDS